MKPYLLIILLLIVPLFCHSQTENNKSGAEIISNRFKETDSLAILIMYKEQIGCLGSFRGKIKIKTIDGRIYFSHISTNQDTRNDFFWAQKTNLIALIKDFETTAKKSKSICGGYVGGTGYQIELTINKSETKFGYCKREFDALGNLIERITALREKTNTNNTYNQSEFGF